jgi:MOSC domain-containing protein YiiM
MRRTGNHPGEGDLRKVKQDAKSTFDPRRCKAGAAPGCCGATTTGAPPSTAAAARAIAMIRVLSVNVAKAEWRRIDGRQVLTAIGKQPVNGPVAVRALGLAGDEQADLSVHGGLGKSVYAYPVEHYAFWRVVRAQARVAGWDDPLAPGSMGENLGIQGLLEGDMWVGDQLRLPHCTLAISEPRQPCFKFNHAMGFAQAAKLMQQSGYCGAYLTVIEPGSVEAGEEAVLLPGPREVNLLELFRTRRSAR